MSQTVHKLPETTLSKMRAYYTHNLESAPNGALFRAKTSNAVITAYKSGKVLFQGKSPAAEAEKWINSEEKQAAPEKAFPETAAAPPESLLSGSHIGSDEAGTGDYFGPITTAAVFVTKEQMPLLKELGVKDSKNLADSTIRHIAKDIVALDMPYSILTLHNPKYNQLRNQGWTQGKMKAILHHQATCNVLDKIDSAETEGILIDQFCKPDVYKRHIASESKRVPQDTYFMTKAESHSIAVAAASILARTSFLQKMDQLAKQAGMTLPKGAAGKVDQAAARLIQAKGKNYLDTCAKTHFANTSKAFKRL
ncbi:ribonuclease HIII [Barrientosiimonas marina]|uniref:Ribonuclease HIII n=1 Tax=Lentibacillus kimchii TaxID=1542911 RepID=A0ABW2USW1_9BACI